MALRVCFIWWGLVNQTIVSSCLCTRSCVCACACARCVCPALPPPPVVCALPFPAPPPPRTHKHPTLAFALAPLHPPALPSDTSHLVCVRARGRGGCARRAWEGWGGGGALNDGVGWRVRSGGERVLPPLRLSTCVCHWASCIAPLDRPRPPPSSFPVLTLGRLQGQWEPQEMRGIIPRAFCHIFEMIEQTSDQNFLVRTPPPQPQVTLFHMPPSPRPPPWR